MACVGVLPDEGGALPDRAVPQLYEEQAHPAMLVVPVPEPCSGAPRQCVSGVEGPADDSAYGGAEGEWVGGRTVEDPGLPGGREVRAGGTRLPRHDLLGRMRAMN